MGTCVHVGGLYHFLKMAEAEGYHSILLGPAVSVDRIVEALRGERPEIMAVSYRLTPEVAGSLFAELAEKLTAADRARTKLVFGGTPPVAVLARESGLFGAVFDGTGSPEEIRTYLRGSGEEAGTTRFAHDLPGRIAMNHPYPVLRHHFGRPTMQETIDGIREIAEEGVLDVISIGTDQNAQEHFFRPGEMEASMDGAGGVPVRSPADMKALYQASRCGNFPLMRCYAGTRDLQQWAEMSVATIRNAWAAIPLCWYSELDGRSQRTLEEAISENREVMGWYARQQIPVEVNESHQWSLRDAHDALAVTMAYLAALNAKSAGVRQYVAQFMFNTPPGTSPVMDLAKMGAKTDLIGELEDGSFSVYREVRAGIAHFSPVPDIAKGQLAASALVSLAMKPHILHVVGHSEGDHATYPGELIESCRIVHGVIRNVLGGMPDPWTDETLVRRREQLVSEARALIGMLRWYGSEFEDPLTSPEVLGAAIRAGILDTPHFRGNPTFTGNTITGLFNGAWHAVDPATGGIMDEPARIAALKKKIKPLSKHAVKK